MTPAENVTQVHLDPSTLIAAVRNLVWDHPSVVVHITDGETGRVLGIYQTPTTNAASPTPARRVSEAMAPIFQHPATLAVTDDDFEDDGDDSVIAEIGRTDDRYGILTPRTRQMTDHIGRGTGGVL